MDQNTNIRFISCGHILTHILSSILEYLFRANTTITSYSKFTYICYTIHYIVVMRPQVKCIQYWPDIEPKTYGDVTVDMPEEHIMTDYIIRKFIAQKVGTLCGSLPPCSDDASYYGTCPLKIIKPQRTCGLC